MPKTAMQRHLDAIASGQVTATNIIGIRKAANHVARIQNGWSGSRSNATPGEVAAAFAALAKCEPLVRGDLHASGVRTVANKRYAKRWTPDQAQVIATLHGFRLVGFEMLGDSHHVPVFRAVGESGSFLFRNVPWQSADALGEKSGPVVVRLCDLESGESITFAGYAHTITESAEAF